MRRVYWAVPGLAVLLGVELLAPAARPGAFTPEVAADDGGQDASQVGGWADTALTRPLFSQDRRPAVADAGDGSLPRLAAILISGGARSALFAAADQKPRLVGEGEVVGPYHIRRISADAVEAIGPDGPVTLHPAFADAVKNDAASTAVAAPALPVEAGMDDGS